MTNTSKLQKLGSKAQRGSKPRCHWLTHGTHEQVAKRLTELIEPYGKVSSSTRLSRNPRLSRILEGRGDEDGYFRQPCELGPLA